MDRKQDRSAPPALGSGKYWPAFNLFRLKLEPDLLCAVPEDHPVPGFVKGCTWAFVGKLSAASATPAGFNERAAAASVRFSGFYIFQTRSTECRIINARPNDGSADLRSAPPQQVVQLRATAAGRLIASIRPGLSPQGEGIEVSRIQHGWRKT